MMDFSTNYQRGSSLTESLVSVLLVAILGLGLVYATSKTLLTQRYTTTQNLAVVNIREHLQTRDPADAAFTIGDTAVALAVQEERTTLNISLSNNGAALLAKSLPNAATGVAVTVESQDLFGGDGTLVLSHGQAPITPDPSGP